MKKLLVVIMILVLSVSFAFAEDMDVKKMDAGLRGGLRSGITGRLFMNEGAKSIEALLTYRRGIIITGLYEWQKPLSIGEIEGLSWYFGAGAHIGLTSWWTSALAIGIDGIVGVEYDLKPLINFPLSVSLDYKPGFDILGGWAGTFADFAFSVRYAF